MKSFWTRASSSFDHRAGGGSSLSYLGIVFFLKQFQSVLKCNLVERTIKVKPSAKSSKVCGGHIGKEARQVLRVFQVKHVNLFASSEECNDSFEGYGWHAH